MSDATDIDQITQYLLGSLPETEAERLDELSITNDEFANALGSAEKDLVDAYVHGELSGATLKQFESHYLATPLRREQVRFAQTFQNFAARAAVTEPGDSERGYSETAIARKSAGWFSALLAPRPALQWGLALAVLVLLTCGALLLFQNVGLRQQMTETQARRTELQQREQELQKQLDDQQKEKMAIERELARVRDERARLEEELGSRKQQPSTPLIASFMLTPQLRSAGQIKTVTIAPETERVAMQLQLEPNEYSTLSVVLLDQGHQVVWRSGRVKARGTPDRKSVSVSFRADLLRPGTYLLRVSGISANGTSDVIGDYPFKVVK